MRKALLVCVVAILAAGPLIVITGLGRVVALWIGGALVLVGVPLMALALRVLAERLDHAEAPAGFLNVPFLAA